MDDNRTVPRTLVFRPILPALLMLVVAAGTGAQPAPRRARLLVSVLDQTNSVLPGAIVVLAGQDDALAAARHEARTSGMGVAVFDNLEPGRYSVRAEFPGFQAALVREVRLRAGDNRRTITLALQKHDEDVTVSRDRQSEAVDPRGSAFSTVLTREQIEALPDDPDEMEAALKAMAPPGATIRVDGFTGGRLPPKSQIRSIRLPRLDMFAAQNHGGMSGAIFIDIMTMPGAGPVRGSLDFNFLDDALDARNAMMPAKGDEQLRQGGFTLSGTITPNKTSFSMSAGVTSQYFSANVLAALPGGTRLAESLRQPQDRWNLSARLDHAINKDHAVRVSFDRTALEQRDLGVGDFNLAERGYASTAAANTLRLSENGPLGRRFFTESRLQVRWSDTSFRSNEEAPTIQVNDAFISGGAQMRGGRQDVTLEAATDLDYVRGNHSWRTGLLIEGGRYASDDTSNYLGTYTFASLADYLAGTPASYTRRVGDPAVRYSQVQAAAYIQDDWRILRSLLLSAGVRYGIQRHVGDAWNLSPRVSAAWSPRRNGSLTIRASYGYFYDWVGTDTYKQTLVVDGYRLRELNILTPAYPDPGVSSGSTPPTNRYLWPGDLSLPNAQRFSVAVDRVLTPNSRLTVAFGAGFGVGLLRARNLNAPVDGVRPDPSFANVFELLPDAASRQQSLNVAWNLNKMNWHRLLLFANYTLSSNRTDTSGAFSTPASDDNLDAEWGPSANDARHRIGGMVNVQPVTNLAVSFNVSYRSALPYNVTTGRDDNGDGVFNDRPTATPRNSARGSATFDLGGRVAYGWGFGPTRTAGGAGGAQVVIVSGGGGGGPMMPGFGGAGSDRRFRVEFYASAQNLLNRTNFTSYSGVLASPLFGQPISAANPRRIQTGVRFSF